MTEKMMKDFAEVLARKMRLTYSFGASYRDNIRELPFFSECSGIMEALRIMGIAYEYEYNAETDKVTAITVGSQRAEI